ncbi:hypothetical protein ZWY2020_049106 [Hordeum vulgare]|nr:hypothetical protein ZWY2020_049106 [Hordeum vulgare]
MPPLLPFAYTSLTISPTPPFPHPIHIPIQEIPGHPTPSLSGGRPSLSSPFPADAPPLRHHRRWMPRPCSAPHRPTFISADAGMLAGDVGQSPLLRTWGRLSSACSPVTPVSSLLDAGTL